MVKLGNCIRVTDTILLPNGERVKVDCNVETNLQALIQTQNATIERVQMYQKDPTNEDARAALYRAFSAFLKAILGAKNYETALAAYDGRADELCEQLDEWAGEEVAPKIVEASKKRMEKNKRNARRMKRFA